MAHNSLFKMNSGRIILCLLAIALMLPANNSALVSRANARSAGGSIARSSPLITGVPGTSSCVMFETGGAAGCRDSMPGESATIAGRDSLQELHVIAPPSLLSESGLQITLRATEQLEAASQAKAAFLRAASVWASRVQTSTAVTIDVDFGPTWFGHPFSEGVVGMSNPQMLVGLGQYLPFLGQLMESASDSHELSLYYAFPQPTMPTDIGETNSVLAPSAVFRTLGFIDPDPKYDPPHFGPPPAIGLNSNLSFDFDPSDGIDAGKYDFEAVVSHEIGHILGFVSAVGQREINPDCDLAVTVWDLFRLRPGASMSSFSTADRILSSGGAQVFFQGETELQLSTGRPDSTGEDGLQPSHWRDDAAAGQRIGIMDPSIPSGARQTITFNDLAALDWFGYTLKPIGNNRPTISALASDLNGDVLTLTGSAADLDGDVVKVEAQFLDEKGSAVAQTAPFSGDFGITPTLALRFGFTGMGGIPAATQIRLVLIDSRGNRSTAVTSDFSRGDDGAVKVSSAFYEGDSLVIKGKRFAEGLQVEINGVMVAPPAGVRVASAKKLIVTAPSASLNLRSGANRIRLIGGGLRSNLLVASL